MDEMHLMNAMDSQSMSSNIATAVYSFLPFCLLPQTPIIPSQVILWIWQFLESLSRPNSESKGKSPVSADNLDSRSPPVTHV